MLLKKSGFEKVRACRLVDFFNGIGKCCNIILDLGCVKYILPVRIHLAPASSQRCSRFSGKIGKMPSTAVRSSTPPSKPSASAAACACSCCRRARPNSIGAVERAQHTHTEEFYQLRPFNSFTVEGLNREARGWERIYNTVYQTGSTPDWLDGASATSDRCADTSGLDRDIR